MDTERKAAVSSVDHRQIGVSIAAQLVGKAVSFFVAGLAVMIFVNPYIGKAGVGIYGAVMFFILVMQSLMDFGMIRIAVRELAVEKHSPELIVGNVILLKLVSAVVLVLLALGVIPFLSSLGHDFIQGARIISFLAFPLVFQMLFCVFQARIRMDLMVIGDITRSLVQLGLFLLFVFSPRDHQAFPFQVLDHGEWKVPLHWFFVALLIGYVVHAVMLVLLSKRLVRPKYQFDRELSGLLLRESAPLGLTAVLAVAYAKIGSFLVLPMLGAMRAGSYVTASQFLDQVQPIHQVVATTLFPLMSFYAAYDRERLKRLYEKAISLTFALGLFIAILLSFYAELAIRVIYHRQFAEFSSAVPCLMVIAWACLTPFMGNVAGSMMIAMGEQGRYFKYTAGVLAFSLAMNLLFIPRLHEVGASIVVVMTEALSFIVCIIRVNRLIQFSPFLKDFWKVALSGLVTIIAALLMRGMHLPWFISMPVVVIIYLGLIVILGVANRCELRSLLSKQSNS